MTELSGIPASPGLVIGPALCYVDAGFPDVSRYIIAAADIPAEWKRLTDAFETAVTQVNALKAQAGNELSPEHQAIFDAHIMMLQDPEFKDQLKRRMEKQHENAEYVLSEVSNSLIHSMLSLPDADLREKAIDIADISKRVLHILLSIERVSLNELSSDTIIVCNDLLPSDLLTMDRRFVKGIVMESGSRTCHTAILARAFEIPAVLGIPHVASLVKTGDVVVVNGSEGRVGLNPGGKNLEHYKKDLRSWQERMSRAVKSRGLAAVTLDGYRPSLLANIEVPEEAEQALRYGAEGIGLYRSEFLFLQPGVATEEERQYAAYSRVLETMQGRPVTIRTLDVGGDKVVAEFRQNDEKNPLLGWRAIRFCLANPGLFKAQLRALLRAGLDNNGKERDLRIMFPMISGKKELEQALGLVDEAKAELRKEGTAFKEGVDIGIMIEIPSAAETADILAKEAAFFSLGTNDLIQYTLAVDRGNERVSYLAEPFHPAVLRLIKKTIDAAHQAGIKAAMCGEMAGNAHSTPLLLGLGLDAFSMSASSLPFVKEAVRSVRLEDCRALAAEVLKTTDADEAIKINEEWLAQHIKLTP
jgi:phosphotransferase system enzyme I (PtsI)